MSKKFMLYCCLLLSVLWQGYAIGGEVRPVHVEWGYPGSAVKFILYKDGVQVCVGNDPVAMQMDCSIAIDPVPMTFTLTAVDAAGVESPQSAPYTLTPPAVDPITGNYIPEASFSASVTSGQAPLAVSFDASASTDFEGVIVSYEWDFGDGGAATGEFADYTFDTPGTYSATLTVTDDGGAKAVRTVTITVTAPPQPSANLLPTAVINATNLAAGTSQMRFDALASTDGDGAIVSYAWNFGDGEVASGAQVDHEYMATGDYTVFLTVTDDQGGVGTDQMIITVVDPPASTNAPPTAAISASTQKRLMHMEWEYSGSDPELAGFRMYQNGRLVCEVADPTVRQADCLAYLDTGEVRLWVTAYNLAGVETSPSANLSFDNTGLYLDAAGDSPLMVHFTPGASSDTDGSIVAYEWNFGDGATAMAAEADHLFVAPGDYTVTLTVTDNSGAQAQVSTIIRVTDGHPPVAVGSAFATDQDKSLTATLTASDPEARPLTYTITKPPSLGAVTVTDPAKGMFTYVPNAGKYGEDSFAFKANDGTFDSNEAAVAVTVRRINSAPMALNQKVTLGEDGKASGTLRATDAEQDVLNYALVAQPVHGTVVLVNRVTGEFIYTPKPDYNGVDSFTFKANDGQLDSGVAAVSLVIAPVNDAPVATNITLKVTEDLRALGKLIGRDKDGDKLTFTIVVNGTKGKAVITDPATGAFVYTPKANANGADTITYRVSDGKLSADAKVTVSIAPVNDAPVATNITLKVTEDLRASGKLIGTDKDGDKLTFTIVVNGTKGKAVITDPATGAFVYTPKANVNGADTITYRVSDGKLSADAKVTVSIAPVNDPPVARADVARVRVGGKVVIAVLLNDSDIDGGVLTLASVARPKYGTAAISSGKVTYTANKSFIGNVTFTYKISDGKGGTATGSITVTVVR